MKQPPESKPVNVSVTQREVSIETHLGASSGRCICNYLSLAAATATLLGAQRQLCGYKAFLALGIYQKNYRETFRKNAVLSQIMKTT